MLQGGLICLVCNLLSGRSVEPHLLLPVALVRFSMGTGEVISGIGSKNWFCSVSLLTLSFASPGALLSMCEHSCSPWRQRSRSSEARLPCVVGAPVQNSLRSVAGPRDRSTECWLPDPHDSKSILILVLSLGAVHYSSSPGLREQWCGHKSSTF